MIIKSKEMTKNALLLSGLIMFCLSLNAQVPKTPDPKFEIYLLMGQSNMAGRGAITPEYQELTHPRVFVWNVENKWSLAKHPLHYDKPTVAGVGPGLAFGMEMAAANPKVKIGLVPCAVGGTSINVWIPGAYDKATKTHPYDDAVLRITEAMKYGTVKGILWHQGEANSAPQNMVGYLDKLRELLTRVRKLVGNENIPVVVGELGRFKDSYQAFNTLLKDAPEVISNLEVASSEALVDKGDLTHFDSESASSLGKRFANKMLLLQKKHLPKK